MVVMMVVVMVVVIMVVRVVIMVMENTEAHLVEKDLLIEAKGIAVKKGRISDEHLIEENSKGPPVDCLVVPPGLPKVKVRPCIGARIFTLDISHLDKE